MKTYLAFLLLAVAARLTLGHQVRTDGCPEPYDRLDETRCILTDAFKDRNYTDSVAFCKTHGGNLLHFDNCTDLTLIYDYLHTEVGLAKISYWLGATDLAKEGEWVWEHDKKPVPMGTPFWHVGEPSTSTTYNCAILAANSYHRWADYRCDGAAKAICLRAR